MSDPIPPTAVVASLHDRVVGARATARGALGTGDVACVVVDVDGSYRPVADERVVLLQEVAIRLGLEEEVGVAAATLAPDQLAFYAGAVGTALLAREGSASMLVLGAGVLVTGELRSLAAGPAEVVVLPSSDLTTVARRAAAGPAYLRNESGTGLLSLEGRGPGPLHDPALYVVGAEAHLDQLRLLAADWRVAREALDTFAAAVGAIVLRDPAVLVGSWRAVEQIELDPTDALHLRGVHVRAVDLTRFDPHHPWLLDARADLAPLTLLSDHPALGQVVDAEGSTRRDDEALLSRFAGPQLALPDPVLRTEARRAEHQRGMVPDVLGLGIGDDLETWALALVPEGSPLPVARYLAAVRLDRPHLARRLRHVPGSDSAALARWARERGVENPAYDADLLARAADVTLSALQRTDTEVARAPGVNLVGYLTGELGVGVSARLVDDALQAVHVPTSTFDVARGIVSRRGARFRGSEPVLRETSIVCVNGGEVAGLAPQLEPWTRGTRVIGMWYWELEDFPSSQWSGYQHVDEIWVATEFMRAAIAEHAGDVPVRTVLPPLPQAGPDPGVLPPRLGIPEDRPWFLFTFDFQSLAARKNPYGLVEAFTRAFSQDDETGPLLVIKTINAARHVLDAERLRCQVAGRDDVLLLDTYLDDHERHVLVSHCTAYVSLHRAEGLGLTVAEAMAWGKPVITTAYGGVMQFCDEHNSLLVDWTYGSVEEASGPYDAGLPWAEPDLDHAADLMRSIVDAPDRAAAIGARAARDVRERHNADVAGRHMRAVLDEGDARWRAAHHPDEHQAPDAPTAGPVGTLRRIARSARAVSRRDVGATPPHQDDQ